MTTPVRDTKLFMVAGIVGLIVGGFAGIAGGVLVRSGRIGPFARYITPVNVPSLVDGRPIVRVEEESATIDVVRKASPAVVSVVVRKEIRSGTPRGNVFPFDDLFEFGVPFSTPLPTPSRSGNGEKRQVGGGSGFIVTSDGYMLTNRHVVADADAEYSVILSTDREFPATVLAKDPLH